ncbi:MAG: hypothetical protein KAS39_04895, partial [Actinomycetia bacterium]|nr:hypothetical protein [Actinomycetes bacterium]
YHVGDILEIDDFKFIWTLGELDDENENKGIERKYTKRVEVGTYAVGADSVYVDLIGEINKEFRKRLDESFFDTNTLFVEFSRGTNFTYTESLNALDEEILKQAVIYYVKVSYNESLRKNKRRYKPEEADSILFHSVPDEVMVRYEHDDFFKLVEQSDDDYMKIKGIRIPFGIFDNEPEKTDDGDKIESELSETFIPMYGLFQKK